MIYHKLLKSRGVDQASQYLKANQNAVREYARMCREIDCDFEYKTSYVYSIDDRRKLEQEEEALSKIGYTPRFAETTELPFAVAGAIGFENQAQFHPLKFLEAAARGLNIYEHTFVKEWKENTAVTDRGNITFQKAVLPHIFLWTIDMVCTF